MAGKKITQLTSGSLSNLTLDSVLPLTYSGTTFQHNSRHLRQILVDSGSHYFTGSQHINGDLTITGSVKSLIVGTGSFHIDNPEILHVQNSGSYNIAHFEGNNQYYTQINLKNTNSGSNASGDIVITADNGTEGVHFVDLGINSSTYTGGLVGRENDAYLLNVGKDLYVGTVGGTNHPAKLHLFAENNWENPQVTVHTGSQVTFNTPSFTEGYMYEFSGSAKMQNDLSINGELTIGSVNEKIVLEVSGGTSSHEFNYVSGSVFYISSSLGNNIYNVSNIPTEDLNAVSLTFIVKQESTPYIASSYKLNNEDVSVSWANNEQPVGNSNKTDVIGLTALRVGSSWNVLGTFTTFG
jgi:hypothetical protein